MSRNIDFQYPCPACKHVSGQAAPKPTLITPTVGWIKCPECLCQLQIQLTFSAKERMPNGQAKLQIVTLRWKQSKRHRDKVMAQRERDAKKKVAIEL